MKRRITIYIMACIIVFNVSLTYAANINDLKSQQKDVQEEHSKTEELIEYVESESNSLLKEIGVLDVQISEVEADIDNAISQLLNISNQLSITEKELADAEKKRINQYEAMKKRIRFMYENGNIGYLEVILNAKGFSDFLNRLEYIKLIIEYDRNMLTNYKAAEEMIVEKKDQIVLQKIKVQNLQESLNLKKSNLEQMQIQKSATLTKMQADKSMYMQQLIDLENSSRKIEKLIKDAENKLAAERKAIEQRKNNSASSGVITTSVPSGQFQWPTPGYYPTSSSYGERPSPFTGVDEFHSGLDIPAPKGTNVLAAEDGTVITSGVISGYGNTVIIEHGNGITTLYAHNSSLIASVGESVKRGQVIAKVGSTGYSTGNHCHIEVRINGLPVNPGKYLS